MTTLTCSARKGGVGKTTSVLNLAAEFSSRGKRVLAVDGDPQGILTLLAGLDAEGLPHTQTLLAAMLPENYDFDVDAITHTAPWGGDIWPASTDMAAAEGVLSEPHADGSLQRLEWALRQVRGRYDLILIDAPPASSKLAYNCLIAADAVAIPTTADYVSVAGLRRFLASLAMIQEHQKPELRLLGVYFSLWRHTVHARETMQAVKSQLNGTLFEAAIPQTVTVQDAQAQHKALRQVNVDDPAARAYAELATEIEERIESNGQV